VFVLLLGFLSTEKVLLCAKKKRSKSKKRTVHYYLTHTATTITIIVPYSKRSIFDNRVKIILLVQGIPSPFNREKKKHKNKSNYVKHVQCDNKRQNDKKN